MYIYKPFLKKDAWDKHLELLHISEFPCNPVIFTKFPIFPVHLMLSSPYISNAMSKENYNNFPSKVFPEVSSIVTQYKCSLFSITTTQLLPRLCYLELVKISWPKNKFLRNHHFRDSSRQTVNSKSAS